MNNEKAFRAFAMCMGLSAAGLLLMLALALSGCATTPAGRVDQVYRASQSAAYIGTMAALRKHPEWRDSFIEARDELLYLETSDTLDLLTLIEIANRLPVKELQSDEATIAIGTAYVIVSALDLPAMTPLAQEDVQKVARGMREGIDRALR